MDGDRNPELSPAGPPGFGPRLAGTLIAGALLAGAISVAVGVLLGPLGRAIGAPAAARAWRAWLGSGAWLWLPLWGGALGAWAALRWARTGRERVLAAALGLALALAPLALRPVVVERPVAETPRTARGKLRAMRRWAYRSPADVARIVPLARDPDPVVREYAALALGLNTVVTDIERASVTYPSRFAGLPLRDSVRVALERALRDPVEGVRAEAAHALWLAPRAFGPEPAAAGTLAAILDRAVRPGALERLTWLALDAAAGARDPALKTAAARFAAATPDTTLARVARQAAE